MKNFLLRKKKIHCPIGGQNKFSTSSYNLNICHNFLNFFIDIKIYSLLKNLSLRNHFHSDEVYRIQMQNPFLKYPTDAIETPEMLFLIADLDECTNISGGVLCPGNMIVVILGSHDKLHIVAKLARE